MTLYYLYCFVQSPVYKLCVSAPLSLLGNVLQSYHWIYLYLQAVLLPKRGFKHTDDTLIIEYIKSHIYDYQLSKPVRSEADKLPPETKSVTCDINTIFTLKPLTKLLYIVF